MIATMLALMGTLFLAQVNPQGTADASGRAYFENLHRDREAIDSGYLEYTLTNDINNVYKEKEGTIRSYRYWFDKNRRRMDLKEVRPNELEEALDSRYAYDGKTHRAIELDRPNFCVEEYTDEYLKKTNKVVDDLIVVSGHMVDPRLLGVIGDEYRLLKDEHLDDLKSTLLEAKVEFFRDLSVAGGETRVLASYPNHLTIERLIPAGTLLPTRFVTHFAKGQSPEGGPSPETRVEMESEVASWPNQRGQRIAFPKTIKTRRITNGKLERSDSLTVRVANFNVPIDPAELTWKALRPSKGAPIRINGEYQGNLTTYVGWDGEKFKSVPDESSPSYAITGQGQPSPIAGRYFRIAAYLALGGSTVFGLALIFLKVSKRMRQVK